MSTYSQVGPINTSCSLCNVTIKTMTYEVHVIFALLTNEKISLERLRDWPKVQLVRVRTGEGRKQLKEHFGQQIISFQ